MTCKYCEHASEVILLVDRSGSMTSIVDDMEPALNKFIMDQKSAGEDGATIRMVRFDNEYEEFYNGSLKDAPKFSIAPRGMTALNDSIGRTLSGLKADRRRVVLIVTDGHENASREWDNHRVKALLDQLGEDDMYAVTYLGANQDAIAVGSNIGINVRSSLTYSPDAQSIKIALDTASNKSMVYRSGMSSTISYTDSERTAVSNEG